MLDPPPMLGGSSEDGRPMRGWTGESRGGELSPEPEPMWEAGEMRVKRLEVGWSLEEGEEELGAELVDEGVRCDDVCAPLPG